MKHLFKRVNTWANHHELTFFLLFLVLLLRIPTLFEPFWYGDENIYLAIGAGIRKGLILYQGITDFPNKPPAIYLLAALARGVFGFRFLLLLSTLLGTAFFYGLAHKITARTKPSIIATLIFIFLTSTPVIEGTIANAEIFFITPVICAAYLLLVAFEEKTKPKHQSRAIAGAGLLLGTAFLFKIHVILDITALGLYFFVLTRLKKLTPKHIRNLFTFKPLYAFIIGLATPIILVLAIWAMLGVSPFTLLTNATGSTGYVAAFGSKDFFLETLGFGSLFSRTVLLAGITLILFIVRNKLRPPFLLLTLWLSFGLFATLLSARPYPHYLIQLVPPLVIGLVLAFHTKHLTSRLAFTFATLLLVVAFFRFQFRLWSVLPYYRNFIAYTSGAIGREEFYRRFDGRMPRNYVLARYLRTITAPAERIFIWGTEPDIYVLADRLPAIPLTTSFHIDDLNYYDQVITALTTAKTNTVVVMESEWRSFPELTSLLAANYTLINSVGDPGQSPQQNQGHHALVYRRLQ